MSPDILIPIVVAVVAAMPGLWAMNSQRRQVEASASNTITDAALDIVKEYKDQFEKLMFETNEARSVSKLSEDRIYQLEKKVNTLEGKDQVNRAEIDRLRREVEGLRTRVRQYREGIISLIRQVEDLGHQPKYQLRNGDE